MDAQSRLNLLMNSEASMQPALNDGLVAPAVLNRLAEMINTVMKLADILGAPAPTALLKEFRATSIVLSSSDGGRECEYAWALVQLHLAGRSVVGRWDVLPESVSDPADLAERLRRQITDALHRKPTEIVKLICAGLTWLAEQLDGIIKGRQREGSKSKMETRGAVLRQRNQDILDWWRETNDLDVVAARLKQKYEKELKPRFWNLKPESLERRIRALEAAARKRI